MTYHEKKLVLHMAINEYKGLSQEEAIKSIMNTMKNNLTKKQLPHIVHITDDLPRTAVGKVDYKLLENVGKELCNKYYSANNLIVLKGTSVMSLENFFTNN